MYYTEVEAWPDINAISLKWLYFSQVQGCLREREQKQLLGCCAGLACLPPPPQATDFPLKSLVPPVWAMQQHCARKDAEGGKEEVTVKKNEGLI